MISLSACMKGSKLQYFLVGFSLICSAHSMATPHAPLVKTAQVSPWHDGIQGHLSCQVSVPLEYTVASESQAKLNYLVSAGSYVKAGDLLAQQDGFYLRQSLNAMRYELIQHKANLSYHEQEYQRLITLDKDHVSASAVNEHALSLELAKHSVAATLNSISTVEKQISALKHYAPADGEVTQLHSNLGSFVARGDAILSFTASNDKELHCELPLTQFRVDQDIAQAVQFFFQSETLKLKRHAQSVNQRHQTQSVWFHVPQKHALPIGKLINVHWQSQRSKLAKLPVQAVIFERDKAYVWRVNKQYLVEKVVVEVMQNQAHDFVVQSPLQVGEQVVVLGQSNLANGTKVRLSPAPTLLAQGE
ncbi:efflux RND transporter periplasmic adaptor subunit [Pseudoalteromonas luteoviolacea]|uniref:efflux RND transporter periplasmic adaptor subunit n=1 Tax=Pseudoalteromonas luteoviolacea TaxID=43657 RepID=UPI0009C06148|nr:efflux RND transporter periplasmic adaptor subunit [Pseudoalteromonas luteoviolacea]